MDLYAYVGGDPINASDPLGLVAQSPQEKHEEFCNTNPEKCPRERVYGYDIADWGKPNAQPSWIKVTPRSDWDDLKDSIGDGVSEVFAGVMDGALDGVPIGHIGEFGGDAARVAGSFCCFAADTPVATQNGLRPIQDIKVGDFVLSKNPETGETEFKPVLATVPRHDRIIFELKMSVTLPDGSERISTLKTTEDHPWRTVGDQWTETKHLVNGSLIQTAYGSSVRVLSVTNTRKIASTYNLEIADFHTYFVGNDRIWVHNTCKISAALDSVVKAIGADARIVRSDSQGFVALSRDGATRFRMDLGGHGDLPHFHVEKLSPSGKWVDAMASHRFYFK